ncbi:MAG: GGDEF domain-containing protein [Vagococcus sp.]
MLNFWNAYIINLSIIIGTTLTLYFFSVKFSLKKNRLVDDFLPKSDKVSVSIPLQVVLGIIIGCLGFLISLNGIPAPTIRPIDVRYLPIYFSVYYGTPLIGTVTTSTLIIAKTIQYYYIAAPPSEYVNNFFLTVTLLVVSIYLFKRNVPPKKSALLFLSSVLIVRTVIFSIIFYPIWRQQQLINISIHFIIFSSIFLLTSWFIHQSISVSQTIHVYRTSSTYDSLTRVYNKESFYFFLDHGYNDMLYNQSPFSLAIIDIDDFKLINDTYGHPVGDQVLRQTAHILSKDTSETRFPKVCRIGGDEFAVFFPPTSPDPDLFLAKALTQLKQSPLMLEDEVVPISLSIGLVHFRATTNKQVPIKATDLYQYADDILYKAKENGKGYMETATIDI